MMEPTSFHDGRVRLYRGDCREALRELPDCSVDSVVTDPPYALVSADPRSAKRASPDPKQRSNVGGFMGQKWDTGETAFDPEFWRDVLRVLKPGGHVLAFGGTRTFHRLACAIEDGGFEIRDAVMWHYSSGFPKSHDVSKGIDKAAGYWRGRAGEITIAEQPSKGTEYERTDKGDPITDTAREWQGWGTALKPATEIISLARKPLSEKTIAANVLRWGVGALNIDGCRIEGYSRDPKFIDDRGNGGTWVDGTTGLRKAYLNKGATGRWPDVFDGEMGRSVAAAKARPHKGEPMALFPEAAE